MDTYFFFLWTDAWTHLSTSHNETTTRHSCATNMFCERHVPNTDKAPPKKWELTSSGPRWYKNKCETCSHSRAKALWRQKKRAAQHGDADAGHVRAEDTHARDVQPGGQGGATASPQDIVKAIMDHGFAIFPGAISPDDAAFLVRIGERLKKESPVDGQGGWDGLFGHVSPFDSSYVESCETSLRHMREMNLYHERLAGIAASVHGKLTDSRILRRGAHAEAMSLLLAEAGAKAQTTHTDYDPTHTYFNDNRPLTDGTVPFPVSCLIALQEGATITSADGVVTPISKYAACLFRGDKRHRGSAYEMDNIRLHIYFSVYKCLVPRDKDGNVIVHDYQEDEEEEDPDGSLADLVAQPH